MLKEIFTSQRQFINFFFDQMNHDEAQTVLAEFLRCQGMIVFTGVGKSGVIADKISKTLISTGTRSIYLPTMSALHGDIGILSPNDLVVILSKSGKSDEAITFAKTVKRRGIRTMSWVSTPASPLAKATDVTIHLPLEREICPFDLAPTTSVAIQLIFGDIIAVALMNAKEFSLDQYALNHPAGAIGKLIAEKVEDVMITGKDLPLCKKEDKLKSVLPELSEKRCGCLLVVDEEMRLEGIFTDGDLRRSLEKYQEEVLDLSMDKLMITSFLHTTRGTLTSHALELMEGKKKVMMLPVLESDKVIGLVHMHHILVGS